MERNAQISSKLSGRGVYVPHVDETPVPCPDGYRSTDCTYCSETIDVGYFGLDTRSDLTTFLNVVVKRLEEQQREIDYLKQKIKFL